MTTKCTGLIGRIFGHKWKSIWMDTYRPGSHVIPVKNFICQRCGAVTGEKK